MQHKRNTRKGALRSKATWRSLVIPKLVGTDGEDLGHTLLCASVKLVEVVVYMVSMLCIGRPAKHGWERDKIQVTTSCLRQVWQVGI